MVKTVVRASLENMQVDLSVPPPTPLVDLLHLTIVRSSSYMGGFKNLCVFALVRMFQGISGLVFGNTQRKFGTVL